MNRYIIELNRPMPVSYVFMAETFKEALIQLEPYIQEEHKFVSIEVNDNKLEIVSPDKATIIIESREPLGKYILIWEDCVSGIDNEDGEAWAEDFTDLVSCVNWLIGEGRV